MIVIISFSFNASKRMYFMASINFDHFTITPAAHFISEWSGLDSKPELLGVSCGLVRLGYRWWIFLFQNNFYVNIIASSCFAISLAIFGLIFLLQSFCLSSVWLWLMSCWEGSLCPPQSQTVWLKLKWSMRRG